VVGLACPFPPNWKHLCGVRFGSYSGQYESSSVWNPANVVVETVTTEAWNWCEKAFHASSLDPLPLKGPLLIDSARAASWILMSLDAGQFDIWDGLSDRDPDFLPTLWKTIFGFEKKQSDQRVPLIFHWVEDSADSRLRVLSPTDWIAHYNYKARETIQGFLPDPGPEWTLSFDDEATRQMAGKFRNRRPASPRSSRH
jgi:hypothetical protein